MRAERYQIALITLGIMATALFGYFLYKEIFPEYRIYQKAYVELENFRSTYTGEPAPDFKMGVKQIVFEREDKGPAAIDRCTSCHVAVQLPHFSPTKIEYDVNGNIVRSVDGTPVQIPNPDYVWARLDKAIAALKDAKVNQQLAQEGNTTKLREREVEAANLESLKTAQVGHHVYDMTKVLSMHPLIGKEIRPFEFHPIEEYGCTSCHSGNGRGLTTEKAHGPVFDGEYEAEFMGYKPEFTEKDPLNDPKFSRVFNDKPGDSLLFQTTPILVGNLIQSSCIQCHQQSASALQGLADTAGSFAAHRTKKTNAMLKGYETEKEALLSLIGLRRLIKDQGLAKAIETIKKNEDDPYRQQKQRTYFSQQLQFLEKDPIKDISVRQAAISENIDSQLVSMLGSEALVNALEKELAKQSSIETVTNFLNQEQQNQEATGSLFVKLKAMNLEESLLKHIERAQDSLNYTATDENVVSAMTSDVDWLTYNYHRGQQLFLAQACYACHRIAGMARGGVGPELTQAGNSYPWYLKESIVWPQADLKTSTMPNFMLDHIELEDLMTFLLGQKGATKSVAQTEYKLAVQEWEAGRKMAWEKPVPPSKIHDLHFGMTVFATEGCAACHRLEGFESNVGYTVEKENKPTFEALFKEKEWFKNLFPEEVLGSAIVSKIEQNADLIDKRIVDHVRKDSILEEIDEKFPETIESYYSNFRFAARAMDSVYKQIPEKTADDIQKNKENAVKLKTWKDRVRRILMTYIQEYGLGRLIGPKPNWSGVYRSDEWLMEHFHNPSSHVARSIMPIFPFDDSKFQTLTYMLDVLGKRNRDALRKTWDYTGFQPEAAFQLLCSQCHGEFLQGNGPIANWIYPIPKNLRNAEFLRNLTRENAIDSITHGVKGTPMPPWGEDPKPKPDYDGTPVMNSEEIAKLVDWLYSFLPGGTVIRSSGDVPKWNYQPDDVLHELKREGNYLKGSEPKGNESEKNSEKSSPGFSRADLELLTTKEIYYASLNPVGGGAQFPKNQEVEDVFDIKPNPVSGEPKDLYYIKKKYYTKENIERGQAFFELNCAVCHGREADGSGARASVMFDAKPRMLNNLDWIKTRDDIRLLRSIKYGVAGTSMTPWGDLTSSLQRLQLVIFIRTLSQEKEKRDALLESLYAAYNPDLAAVEELRIKQYPHLDSLQKEYALIKSKRFEEGFLPEGPSIQKSQISLYQRQLELDEQLKQLQANDQLLVSLKDLISKEKDIYQTIGNEMISSSVDEDIWQKFLEIIPLRSMHFTFKEGNLSVNRDAANEKKAQVLIDEMAANLENHKNETNKELAALARLPASLEKDEKVKHLQQQLNISNRIAGRLLSGTAESELLKQQEISLLEQINKENKGKVQ